MDQNADSNGAANQPPQPTKSAESYADQLATQLRKGFLAYCVLVICAQQPHYTGDLVKRLHQAELTDRKSVV